MIFDEKYNVVPHHRIKKYYKSSELVVFWCDMLMIRWLDMIVFCGDKSPFYGATGTCCFRLMDFKARVDPS